MSGSDRVVDVADCLTEGKAEFAKQRFLECALGGMRLMLPTSPPWYIRVFQIVVFLLPMIVGTVVCCTVSSVVLAGGIVGGFMLLLVACLQLATWLVRRRENRSTGGSAGGALDDLLDIMAVDGDVEFEAFWEEGTWRFLVPPKSAPVTLGACLAALALGVCATCAVHPATTSGGDGSLADASTGGIIALVWGWLVVALAAFSITCAPPPEMGRWDASTGGHTSTQAIFNRPLAVMALASPAVVVVVWRLLHDAASVPDAMDAWAASEQLSGATNLASALHICSVFFHALPLLWMAGAVSPARALLEVAIEMVLVEVLGASHVYATSRLVLHVGGNVVTVAAGWLIATNLGTGWAVGIVFAATLVLDRTVMAYGWEQGLCNGRRGKCWAPTSYNSKSRVIPVASTPVSSSGRGTSHNRTSDGRAASAGSVTYPASIASVAVGAPAESGDNGGGALVKVAQKHGGLGARRANNLSPPTIDVASNDRDESCSCLQALGVGDGVAAVVLAGAAIAAGALLPTGCTSSSLDCKSTSTIVAAAGFAAMALAWLAASLQRPFVLGFCRNRWWSYHDVGGGNNVRRRRGLLRRSCDGAVFRALRVVMVVAPVLWAVLVLPTDAPATNAGSDAAANTWLVFWTCIAARRLCQRAITIPAAVAWELALLHLVSIDAGTGVGTDPSEAGWQGHSLWVRLLVAGFIVRRVPDMYRKVWYMITHITTSVTEKKLRFASAGKVAIASVVLSPLLLAVAAYSSFFMSPVLPLLGLPIFLPAFPRPRRQWQVVSTSETASSTDAAMYKQLVPQLAKSLQWLVQHGVLGEVVPGACFMVRMETLVAAVQVLEVGFGRVVVSIRGLEQQEPTSCHNVEAGILDNVFAQINKDETQLKGNNGYMSHTVSPAGVMPVMAFTASKMALVGILDRPDVLACIDAMFYRTLALCLRRYVVGHFGAVPDEWLNCSLSPDDMDVARRRYPGAFIARVSGPGGDDAVVVHGIREDVAEPQPARSGSSEHARASSPHHGAYTSDNDHHVAEYGGADDGGYNSADNSRRYVHAQPASTGDVYARTSSRSHHRDEPSQRADPQYDSGVADTLAAAVHSAGEPDDLDALLADVMADSPAASPLPRYSAGRRRILEDEPGPASQRHGQPHHDARPPASPPRRVEVAPPPVAGPRARHAHGERKVEAPHGHGSSLTAQLRALTECCYGIMQVAGLGCCDGDAVAAGPAHVMEVFNGGVPTSLGASWLLDRKPLLRVCTRAYRLAVKAAIDAGVMMECEDILEDDDDAHSDLMEALDDLQSNWFIGLDTSPEWVDAIARETPHLFSLAVKQSDRGNPEYSGHLLTLQEQAAFIGWMNNEALMAIWASLSQELLFFTNDDDERYSIQAHKTLIRNLSIQMAQPPLGYPVWNSGPVAVHGSLV